MEFVRSERQVTAVQIGTAAVCTDDAAAVLTLAEHAADAETASEDGESAAAAAVVVTGRRMGRVGRQLSERQRRMSGLSGMVSEKDEGWSEGYGYERGCTDLEGKLGHLQNVEAVGGNDYGQHCHSSHLQ